MSKIKAWVKERWRPVVVAAMFLWSAYSVGAALALGAIDAARLKGVTVVIGVDGEEK